MGPGDSMHDHVTGTPAIRYFNLGGSQATAEPKASIGMLFCC
jgi:hypothetical protein